MSFVNNIKLLFYWTIIFHSLIKSNYELDVFSMKDVMWKEAIRILLSSV